MAVEVGIGAVVERDIDLLVLEECIASPPFTAWLADRVFGEKTETILVSARRSATQSLGESDLELLVERAGVRVLVMIENKIRASFQPLQAERYGQRGVSAVDCKRCELFRTVLLAPRIFGPQGTAGFDVALEYEELLSWFSEDGSPRSRYKIRLLEEAIAKGTHGYQPVEDKPITSFWQSYWDLACSEAPDLCMRKPAGKPARSTFVYFAPEALEAGDRLCHKLHKGYVDLQFPGMARRIPELRRQFPSTPEDQFDVAGKAGVIRMPVPRLNPNERFDAQVDSVRGGLQAARSLLEIYLQRNSRD